MCNIFCLYQHVSKLYIKQIFKHVKNELNRLLSSLKESNIGSMDESASFEVVKQNFLTED